MDFPRVLRFPVPLDKGNEGSGDEIAGCNELFSFCAWPEQKICFRYAVVVAPVVVLKVSIDRLNTSASLYRIAPCLKNEVCVFGLFVVVVSVDWLFLSLQSGHIVAHHVFAIVAHAFAPNGSYCRSRLKNEVCIFGLFIVAVSCRLFLSLQTGHIVAHA